MAERKTTPARKSNTLYSKRLADYLRDHYVKKENGGPILEKTNTRIGDKELKIAGGTRSEEHTSELQSH